MSEERFLTSGTGETSKEGADEAKAAEAPASVKISCRLNGPLHIVGNLTIENAEGQAIFQGDDAWLCRCGGSKNKPFCDGTHKKIGFRSGEGEGFPPSRSQS